MGYRALLPKDISKNSGPVRRFLWEKTMEKPHLRGFGAYPWIIPCMVNGSKLSSVFLGTGTRDSRLQYLYNSMKIKNLINNGVFN